jgi:hypothetical protein
LIAPAGANVLSRFGETRCAEAELTAATAIPATENASLLISPFPWWASRRIEASVENSTGRTSRSAFARLGRFHSAPMKAEREAGEFAGYLSQDLLELPEFAPLGGLADDRVPFVEALGKLVNPQPDFVAAPWQAFLAPPYAFRSIHYLLRLSWLHE